MAAVAGPDHVSYPRRVVARLADRWTYYVRCRADNAAYLRRLGWRVGTGGELLISYFGSEPWLIEIGDRVTIAAGTHLPPGTVWAGVPARMVCTVGEYKKSYVDRMVATTADTRSRLRADLTRALWGEER